MMWTRRFLLVTLLLTLTACQNGVAPDYYRLDAPESLGETAPGPSLGIMPIEIPEYLSRSGLVRDAGNLTIEVSDTERWAEPLDSGISRVMAQNLARAIPTNDLRPYPWNSKRRPTVSLRLKITEMRALPGRATLTAETQLQLSDGAFTSELISLETNLSSPASGSDIAQAYSQLLADLSVRLGENIRASAISGDGAAN